MLASLNATELAQRRFREIARVSGLIFQGYPGEKRSNKQLQASSSLFYEVFRKYDPTNRLLLQALAQPSPFAFPLMVERLREQFSNDSLADRIARMVAQLDPAAITCGWQVARQPGRTLYAAGGGAVWRVPAGR